MWDVDLDEKTDTAYICMFTIMKLGKHPEQFLLPPVLVVN